MEKKRRYLKMSTRHSHINFSITPGFFLDKRLNEDFFRQIVEYGFKVMELPIYGSLFRACPEDIKNVKKMCNKCEVKIESIHCDFQVLDASRIREAKSIICENLELTSELGARYLVVHSSIFADPDNIIRDENNKAYPGFSVFRDTEDESTGMLERVKGGMVFFAERANELGVVIALETDWWMNDRLVDFISYTDTESCGICFDTGHAQVESDAVMVAKTVGPKIVCTHLHDNDGKEDLHLPPFKGVIDWQGVITELVKAEYKGSYTFECLKGTMDEIIEAREKIVSILNQGSSKD